MAKSIGDSGFAEVVEQLSPRYRSYSVTRLTGGVSANTYAVTAVTAESSTLSWVLREHGADHSGHTAETEFALLQALHQAGLAVPQPLLCDASRQHSDYEYLVMSHIQGSSVIEEEAQARCIDKMAQQLWAIHSVSTATMPDLPRRINPLPEVFDYLPQGSEWSDIRKRLLGVSDSAHKGALRLLHGDYWPENILWQQEDIVGILDWEDAAVGDPLSDVAAASMELRYLFGLHGQQRFVCAYHAYSPIDQQRLALWQVYVAAAAQHFMGQWGLAAEREAHMRSVALASIREAAAVLRQ